MGAMLKGGVALANKDVDVDHALADRRRDEDVPRPAHAGDLHAERHHRPAARPGHERGVPRSSTTTCASKYGAEPGFITMNMPRCSTCWSSWASTTRSSAPTSTRSAFACAAASSSTSRRSRRGASGRSRCRCWRRARSAPREAIEYVCEQPHDRVDRVRRVEPRQHPADQGADRRTERVTRIGVSLSPHPEAQWLS